MNSERFVNCRDFAGRKRTLRVVVRGSEVVVVAPPGEAAVLDPFEAGQFRSAYAAALVEASTPASGAPGAAAEIRTASTVEQFIDGRPPTVEGRPVPLSCRGRATAPTIGPAAIPSLGGGNG